MNPPKCEQYFYLFYQERKSLDHLKEIKEAEKNTIIPPFLLLQRQGGHTQAGCWSQHPPGGVTAHALRSAGSTANAPLPNNHSLLIFDRQPKCFCEESKWTTYEKINCFSRTSITGKGWFCCPQTTLFLRLLGCLWVVGKNILGVRYMVWSLLLPIHSFIFSFLHGTGCLTVKPRNH